MSSWLERLKKFSQHFDHLCPLEENPDAPRSFVEIVEHRYPDGHTVNLIGIRIGKDSHTLEPPTLPVFVALLMFNAGQIGHGALTEEQIIKQCDDLYAQEEDHFREYGYSGLTEYFQDDECKALLCISKRTIRTFFEELGSGEMQLLNNGKKRCPWIRFHHFMEFGYPVTDHAQ